MKSSTIITIFVLLWVTSCKTPKSTGTTGGGMTSGGGMTAGGGGAQGPRKGNTNTVSGVATPSIIGSSGSGTGMTGATGVTGTTAAEGTANSANGRQIDTAGMVKSFIDNKSRYKNRELGALLNDLSIPVKSSFILNHRLDMVDGIELAFDDRQTAVNKMNGDDPDRHKIYLHITFATPIPAAVYNAHAQSTSNGGNWDAGEQKFYSGQIVGDLW